MLQQSTRIAFIIIAIGYTLLDSGPYQRVRKKFTKRGIGGQLET